jgi:hypothetical protein
MEQSGIQDLTIEVGLGRVQSARDHTLGRFSPRVQRLCYPASSTTFQLSGRVKLLILLQIKASTA